MEGHEFNKILLDKAEYQKHLIYCEKYKTGKFWRWFERFVAPVCFACDVMVRMVWGFFH